MAATFSLFILFCLLMATLSPFSFADSDISTGIIGKENEDPIIHQVVDKKSTVAEYDLFALFKKEYGKLYATKVEEDYRFLVFKANLRRVMRFQGYDTKRVHMTQFSDLTPRERQLIGLNRTLRAFYFG